MSTLNIKRWLFLFLTTLLIGGISIILTGIVIGWEDLSGANDTASEVIAAGIWLFIVGLMFSVISQMGFFAYLMIHRFGLGIFKSHRLWNLVQIILILFTFFDLVYFRYSAFGNTADGWSGYLILPSVLLIVAIIGGVLKASGTNRTALIPAIFFLFVVTTVEIVPALTQNDANWIILMLVPLTLCNVWQLLMLHRLQAPANDKSA